MLTSFSTCGAAQTENIFVSLLPCSLWAAWAVSATALNQPKSQQLPAWIIEVIYTPQSASKQVYYESLWLALLKHFSDVCSSSEFTTQVSSQW